jgi:hypothetical protein
MIVVNSTQSSLARAARNSPGTLRQDRPTWASHSIFHFRQSTSFFSHYYALFCTAQNPNSFRFILFRTLCTKHPGWVHHHSPIAVRASRSDRHSPLVSSLATRFTPSLAGPRATKSLRIHISAKLAHNSLENEHFQNKALKVLQNEHLQKAGEGYPATARDRSVGHDMSCPLSFSCLGIARQPSPAQSMWWCMAKMLSRPCS